jgi:hypothetical protein
MMYALRKELEQGKRALLAFFKMRDIAHAFLRRPGVILLVVLGFVGPTLVFTLLQPTVYEASTRVGIEPDFGDRWETGIPGVQLLPPPLRYPASTPWK